MQTKNVDGQPSSLGQDSLFGKMCRALFPAKKEKISSKSSKHSSRLKNRRFMLLDLRPGAGNLLGPFWEYDPPWLGPPGTLNTSACPKNVVESSLSQILQDSVPSGYYLSQKACLGILKRAAERGKALPKQLEIALKLQAGLISVKEVSEPGLETCPMDHQDESCTIGGVIGVPAAGEQQHHFTQAPDGTGISAFHINQRDEGIDLGDKSGALMATNNLQMQTFITYSVNAGFLPESSNTARDIVCQEEFAPSPKAGGKMECSEDQAGTLYVQEHDHQPLVFSNHGQSATYTGPVMCAPTVSASYGEGGNNVPFVADGDAICILGNAINRAPHNGGNGLGVSEDLAYTVTSADRHAVFSRQSIDRFKPDHLASTESRRQYKDATDLVISLPAQELQNTDMEKPEFNRSRFIRRFTPLECERLQGFPDLWTQIPRASDTARYKALGNSVAVPCVDLLMQGIALAIKDSSSDRYSLNFEERK